MLSKFLQNRPQIHVQPRMGVASLKKMQAGLRRVKNLAAPTLGTITLDSYTRTEKYEEAAKALKAGLPLNGFPILSYPQQQIKDHIISLIDHNFPIQVRHGTAKPQKIIRHLLECGLYLTEGGPISYCLPYSQVPLKESIAAWEEACGLLAQYPEQTHLESFAGCMLGQLCHPTLLVSLGILEGLFFQHYGLKDISLSYAQQYNLTQDVAAVKALKRLAHLYFSSDIAWHIVIYTFMGLFPETKQGHHAILQESVQLAKLAQAQRLIVKTYQESFQIPSITSNLEALSQAHSFSELNLKKIKEDQEEEDLIFNQSKQLIEAVLNLDKNINQAFIKAFNIGYLDVPYCLHPDNQRLTLCAIDSKGYLQWIETGNLPLRNLSSRQSSLPLLDSTSFLKMLKYNCFRFNSLI